MPTVDEIVEAVQSVAKHGACAHSRRVIESLLAKQIEECALVADRIEGHIAGSPSRTAEALAAASVARHIRELAK